MPLTGACKKSSKTEIRPFAACRVQLRLILALGANLELTLLAINQIKPA